MRKSDLINQISLDTGMEKPEALAAVESFMKVVKHAVKKGDNVYLRGFGSFERIEKRATVARDIGRNIQVALPAKNIPKFFPSDAFKKEVSE